MNKYVRCFWVVCLAVFSLLNQDAGGWQQDAPKVFSAQDEEQNVVSQARRIIAFSNLSNPTAVAADVAGNIFFVSDGARIQKRAPDGIVSTVAGVGTRGFSGDGGSAASAQLNNPAGLAVDAAGNLFIADSSNNRVRKVTPDGRISTVAGPGLNGKSAGVFFDPPMGVTVDAAGNLFIGHTTIVYKLTPAGVMTTIAGMGTHGSTGDGGPAIQAKISSGTGSIAVDREGNLFIADLGNRRIRRIDTSGVISTVLEGSAWGIAVDREGNLFVSEPNERRVRKVSRSGLVTIAAGSGSSGILGDGGPAASAQLSTPRGIAVDSSGNLYIAEAIENRIRKVTKEGAISTVNPLPVRAPSQATLIASLNGPPPFLSDEGTLSFFRVSAGAINEEKQVGGQFCGYRIPSGFYCSAPAAATDDNVSFSLPAGDYQVLSYVKGCNGNCDRLSTPQVECRMVVNLKANETLFVRRFQSGTDFSARSCSLIVVPNSRSQ